MIRQKFNYLTEFVDTLESCESLRTHLIQVQHLSELSIVLWSLDLP